MCVGVYVCVCSLGMKWVGEGHPSHKIRCGQQGLITQGVCWATASHSLVRCRLFASAGLESFHYWPPSHNFAHPTDAERNKLDSHSLLLGWNKQRFIDIQSGNIFTVATGATGFTAEFMLPGATEWNTTHYPLVAVSNWLLIYPLLQVNSFLCHRTELLRRNC